MFDRKAHLAKLAEARRGKPRSEETKRKLAEAMRGRYDGAANPHWNGGSCISKGYRYIYRPDHPNATQLGYVMEHRLVMEESIGRVLSKTEAVHHKDGNRLNNDISNLELCSSKGRHTIDHHAHRNASGRFICV